MIKKVNIQNFKCFTNIELDLKDLTILAGINAVGKTSFIHLLLLSQIAANSHDGLVGLNTHYTLHLGEAKNLFHDNTQIIKAGFEFDNSPKIQIQFTQDKVYNSYLKLEESLTNTELAKLRLLYINAERQGPRLKEEIGVNNLSVGCYGEYTNQCIFNADNLDYVVHPELQINKDTKKFSAQVEKWLDRIMGGMNIQIKTELSSKFNISTISYKNNISDMEEIAPTATGFGISYCLPIIVQGLIESMNKDNCLLIIENPEAHMHPYAQSQLGKFIAVLANTGVQVIVETHSEHFINGARLQMAKLGYPQKLIIDFFLNDRGLINIEAINIDQFGEINNWPQGFFDQEQNDLREILEMKIRAK